LRAGRSEVKALTRRSSPAKTARHERSLALPAAPRVAFDEFLAVDVRVGTIVAAEPFPQARKPAFKLTIDFGPDIGVKKSSAQITKHYTPETLVGRQVAAVVNFAPRQIGPFMSEVLTLGFPDAEGEVVLIGPSLAVPNGGRLF
jgi:tRNA-binding protein